MRTIGRPLGRVVEFFLPTTGKTRSDFSNFASFLFFMVSAVLSAAGGWWFLGMLTGGSLGFSLIGSIVGIAASFGVSYAAGIGARDIVPVALVISMSTSTLFVYQLTTSAALDTEEAWLSGRDLSAVASAQVDQSTAEMVIQNAEEDLSRARESLTEIESIQRNLRTCTSVGAECQAAYDAQVFLGNVEVDSKAGPNTSRAVEARRQEYRESEQAALEARDAAIARFEEVRERQVSDEQVALQRSARDARRESVFGFVMTIPGVTVGVEPVDAHSVEWERWVRESTQRAKWVVLGIALLLLTSIDLQSWRWGSRRIWSDDDPGPDPEITINPDGTPARLAHSPGGTSVSPEATPLRPLSPIDDVQARIDALVSGPDGGAVDPDGPSDELERERRALLEETVRAERAALERAELMAIREQRARLRAIEEQAAVEDIVEPAPYMQAQRVTNHSQSNVVTAFPSAGVAVHHMSREEIIAAIEEAEAELVSAQRAMDRIGQERARYLAEASASAQQGGDTAHAQKLAETCATNYDAAKKQFNDVKAKLAAYRNALKPRVTPPGGMHRPWKPKHNGTD